MLENADAARRSSGTPPAPAPAPAPHAPATDPWAPFYKWGSLTALTFQAVIATSLLRLSRTSQPDPDKRYFISAGIAVMQAMKVLASLVLLRLSSSARYASMADALADSWRATRDDSAGTALVAATTLLYVAQNVFIFKASKYLDTTVFLVFSQLKTFTAAIFAVLIVRRHISLLQWASLCLLVAGVVLLQTSVSKDEKKEHAGHASLGFLLVLCSSTISGLAGTMFEMLVQSDKEVPLWIRALQLNLFSAIVALLFAIAQDCRKFLELGFFHGFNPLVWATLAAQGFGGLIVILVLKYADNVMKSFSSAMAILISIFLDSVLFKVSLPMNAVVGAGMVVLAMFGYNY